MKFPTLKRKKGTSVRRYPYTAIDDVTSHRTDKDEFYPLLTYRDDVDQDPIRSSTGEAILVKNVRLDS